MCLDERIPNIVSELSLDYTLPLLWPKKRQKIVEIGSLVNFDGFSAKACDRYYPSSILTLYLESCHHDETFRPQYERKLGKMASHSISKFNLLCANLKGSYYGRKIALFCYSHWYHGTGLAPKTWKKLSSDKNETP